MMPPRVSHLTDSPNSPRLGLCNSALSAAEAGAPGGELDLAVYDLRLLVSVDQSTLTLVIVYWSCAQSWNIHVATVYYHQHMAPR